jgi:hypothetical protein
MKILSNIIKAIGTVVTIIILSFNVNAQGPPPPPGGASGTGNSSGNQNGGNAPIGGGVFILMGLAAVYGTKKFIDKNKQDDPS